MKRGETRETKVKILEKSESMVYMFYQRIKFFINRIKNYKQRNNINKEVERKGKVTYNLNIIV